MGVAHATTEALRLQVLTDEEAVIRAARENRDVFKQYVLKDNNGNDIRQATIHRSWNRHIKECIAIGKYAGIVAPFGHGKTEQITIGEALYLLGRNPQLRIKIISDTDTNARSRVVAIRKYIESSEEYHRVFPDIRPDTKQKWNDHQLFVCRKGNSKDPSIEAWGVTSSGIGSRADVEIFDDPINQKNAILEPASRSIIIQTVRETWMSRIDNPEPGIKLDYPQVIWVATVWHELDATVAFVMQEKNLFSVLKQSINQEKTAINCDLDGARKWTIPLWVEKWDTAALHKKFEALGPRGFARGFENRPFSDDDIILKSFASCLNYDTTPLKVLARPGTAWRVATGIDVAGEKRKGFALFTLACEKSTGLRVPIDIRVGAWRGQTAIEQAVEVYNMVQAMGLNHEAFIVENNNTQEIFADNLRDAGKGHFNVVSFNTGNNKADLEVGLPSMDIEFFNGLWLVALAHADHKGNPGCTCGWCTFVNETNYYPAWGSSDILMASWFARDYFRQGHTMESILNGILGAGQRSGDTGDRATVIPEMIPISLRRGRGRSGRGSNNLMGAMSGW